MLSILVEILKPYRDHLSIEWLLYIKLWTKANYITCVYQQYYASKIIPTVLAVKCQHQDLIVNRGICITTIVLWCTKVFKDLSRSLDELHTYLHVSTLKNLLNQQSLWPVRRNAFWEGSDRKKSMPELMKQKSVNVGTKYKFGVS